MPQTYQFGAGAAVQAAAGARGAHGVKARPDYVALSIRSGRNSIDLHVSVDTAEAAARELLRAVGLLRAGES